MTRCRPGPALLLQLLLCVPLLAQAQHAPAPPPQLQLPTPCALPTYRAACHAAMQYALSGKPGPDLHSVQLDSAARVDRRTARVVGAVGGFVIGAGATYVLTRTGGSNSLCDRDRNQDALNANECAGLTLLGGAVGAGIGFVIGGAIVR